MQLDFWNTNPIISYSSFDKVAQVTEVFTMFPANISVCYKAFNWFNWFDVRKRVSLALLLCERKLTSAI